MDLLSLPYDIRYLIYTHLFPPNSHIYIQALPSHLICIRPPSASHEIATNFLRVNKFLHAEAAEFLYSSYLFSIVGIKAHCLSRYRPFLETTKKYSREPVRVDAFSNGVHSATACLSIQAGTGRMEVLQRRGRGEPIKLEDLEKEVRLSAGRWWRWQGIPPMVRRQMLEVTTICAALLAVVVALLRLYVA